jgi:hypothetical protein
VLPSPVIGLAVSSWLAPALPCSSGELLATLPGNPAAVRVAAGANGAVWTLHRTSDGTARLARLVGGALQEVPVNGPGTSAEIRSPGNLVDSFDLTLQNTGYPDLTPDPMPYFALAAPNLV